MSAPDVPQPTAVSAPFWEATRRRELVLQWCPQCARLVHYPRARCPSCGGDELDWRPMSGAATVYAAATHHPRAADPYCIALVDLAEGARLLTRIVDVPPDEVQVGDAVTVRWWALDDGRNLPVFGPAR